jgi:hypothetical protein
MRGLVMSGLVLVMSCAAAASFSQVPAHVAVVPDEIKWGPASPKLPPGAEIAVLVGDPSVPGAPYVFRAKLPDGYSVPPHWHPMDENVTVMEGVFALGFGERADRTTMRDLPAGSYVTLPKQEPHFNRIKGRTILQFHGSGHTTSCT